MMKQQWKYKVGGRPQGLIPTLILLAVFAGLSVWLHVAQNGAALFTIILSIFMFVILLVVIYRAVFVKILIFEDGFFYQTKPGNGKYYSYSQIKKAWESSGKVIRGMNSYFCCFETLGGQVIRFPFLPYESKGVHYLIKCADGTACGEYAGNLKKEEYKIDGKPYGIARMIIAFFILIFVSIFGISMILHQATEGFTLGAILIAGGILLPLSVLIRLIIRYFCFKVYIEDKRFYFQTNPFNGKYYQYSDIKGCKEELKIVRHWRFRQGSHGSRRSYFYFFFFTDRKGRTKKFQFQKDIHGHEIEALKTRIQNAN